MMAVMIAFCECGLFDDDELVRIEEAVYAVLARKSRRSHVLLLERARNRMERAKNPAL